jgi:uncharacterized membrane protein
MQDKCVVAEYETPDKARTALEVLARRGFTQETVSVVTRQDRAPLDTLEQGLHEKQSADAAGMGAGVGALLAGGVVAPLAIGSMVANFFVVGPLAAMALGAAAGGVLGGARRWGMPEEATETYQQRLDDGSILIIVSAEGDELKEAESGLLTVGPLSMERFAFDGRPVSSDDL